MKLYHYAPVENTVLKDGLLSVSQSPRDLKHYFHRAGSEDRQDIMNWLDSTFPGRSRAVSCLTEQIRWQGNDPMLKWLVENRELFSFDLDELVRDGLVEAVWCKDGSDPGGTNEKFYRVEPKEIDFSPLSWEKCSQEKDLLFAVIRHYILVLKDGIIPSGYLKKEKC